MAEPARGPFREKSLERLSSPERLDQLLTVVDRKSWLPLLTLGALTAIIVVWSIVGEVPVNIEGKGILVRPRGVVEFSAPGSGYLESIGFEVGDEVERGDVLAWIARPDLIKRLKLQNDKRDELKALRQSADILRIESAGREDPSLEGHIDAVRELARGIKEKEDRSIGQEQAQLQEELTHARKLRRARAQRYDGQNRLFSEGLISNQQLLDDEEAWIDSVARVSRLEAQLRATQTRELEVEDRFLDRLRGIANFKLELQDYEQQIAEVDREIQRIELALVEERQIEAEHAGRILEFNAVPGQFVETGTRLGALELRHTATRLEGLAYFTVRDGKRLRVGTTPRILITPDTVERQRFGGLVGTVSRISRFPVTLSEVESQIGNREVAEALISGGYRIQVLADLTPAEIPGQYLWSSARDPDVEITAGTTTTARIAVERRRPITFVLPFLKETMGID